MEQLLTHILTGGAGFIAGVVCCILIIRYTGTKPRSDRRRPAGDRFEIVPPLEVIQNEQVNEN